jgi:hypothetical protein
MIAGVSCFVMLGPYQVTVSPEGVVATACSSKDEARILASKKTLKVFMQDATNKA